MDEVLLAAHHSLLAHGMAVQAIRAGAKSPPVVGGAPVGFPKIPHTGAPEDIEAARTAMFSMDAPGFWNNAWFGDAMVFGRYPEDGVAMFGEAMPEIRDGDMETIGQPLDFFGVNIYFGDRVRAGADGRPETVPPEAGAPRTTMGWVAEPESLYWGPRLLHERYQLPIVITENGMANTDWVQSDGRVQDPQRIDFLARYLREYRRAIADGVEAKGYFLWSILDNFEWSYGYAKRFGIVHVDYATGKRTPKDSAAWYREVIRSNGEKI
jgi:beta-glucosidase